ncbi:MAG: hypothetical protein ACR2MS_00310 [Weeksellaceae bacterium]
MQNYTIDSQISETIIQDRLNNGYNLDIGSYISTAWEIFKKEWLTFSLYSLIVLVIIATGIGAFAIYPLMLGFFLGADKVAKGQPLSISDMFGGFNKNLGKLILLFLVPFGVMLIIYIPFMGIIVGTGMLGSESSDAAGAVDVVAMGSMFLMYILIFIAAIVLSLALFFAPYLIYFGDYSVMDALKTSWKLAMKNVLMLIVYSLLISLITQIGIFACFVGIVASIAMGYVCYYPMIKDVLFNEKIATVPTTNAGGY